MSASVIQNTAMPHVHMPLRRDGKEMDLARSTVYLEFSLHLLGTNRKVPQTLWGEIGIFDSQENEDAEKLDKDLINVSKKLFHSRTLSSIRTFDGHLRDRVRGKCLPFKRGTHFLPISLIRMVEAELVARRRERQGLVDQFLKEYPELCRNASKSLTRKFFNIADYPAIEDVAACFRMSWKYIYFGVPDALAQVDPEIFETAKRQASAQLRQAAADIEGMMRTEALKLVRTLSEALQVGKDGRKKKLTDATFTNLAEFLAFFDHRNVTNDSELKAIVEELRTKLRNNDVEQIRNTAGLRQQLAQQMATVTKQLTSMVELVPRRKMTLH